MRAFTFPWILQEVMLALTLYIVHCTILTPYIVHCTMLTLTLRGCCHKLGGCSSSASHLSQLRLAELHCCYFECSNQLAHYVGNVVNKLDGCSISGSNLYELCCYFALSYLTIVLPLPPCRYDMSAVTNTPYKYYEIIVF